MQLLFTIFRFSLQNPYKKWLHFYYLIEKINKYLLYTYSVPVMKFFED